MTQKELPQNPCPRCRKLTDWYDNPFRPFCSERCKILDLGAWASEEYRIPSERVSGEGEETDTGEQKESEKDEGPQI